MKNRSEVALAVPLNTGEHAMPDSFVVSEEAKTETEKRMLLFRLSDAAMRIREEADLIRRTGFTDQASRLMRILGEAVEEQHAALKSDRQSK